MPFLICTFTSCHSSNTLIRTTPFVSYCSFTSVPTTSYLTRTHLSSEMWLCSAIAVLLSLGSTALAQGSIGGDQSACANSPNGGKWQYTGCYTTSQVGRHAGFDWQYDVNTVRNYPNPPALGMTVTFCQTVCRGHGFRYSAVFYGSECYCATTFPNPTRPLSDSTLFGPGQSAQTPVTPVPDLGNCNAPCLGDPTQTCGGGDAASVYSDPTFSSTSIQSPAAYQSPANYLYLGCYDVTGPGPMFLILQTSGTVNCQTFCGQLGYSFSARTGKDSDIATKAETCGCGTEIEVGYQKPESDCSFACDGSSTTLQ